MEDIDYHVDELVKSRLYPQREFHRTRFEDELKLLDKECDSYLDIGCGDALHFSRIKFRLVVGVDHNESTITRGKGKKLIISKAEKLPFKDESFDCISCHHLIEHLDNPENLILEIMRVLKPKGRVIISTPNYRSLWVIVEFFWARLGLFNPVNYSEIHVQHFTPKKIRSMLEKSGFKVLKIETYQPFLIPFKKAKRFMATASKLKIFRNLGMILAIKAEKQLFPTNNKHMDK